MSAKEDLEVQRDRIIEQYKLDLNVSDKILNNIASTILEQEKDHLKKIADIVDFFNPKELRWEDYHGTDYDGDRIDFIFQLRSIGNIYATIYIGKGGQMAYLNISIVTKPKHGDSFTLDVGLSKRYLRMSRKIFNKELSRAKQIVIDELNKYGIKLPEVKDK